MKMSEAASRHYKAADALREKIAKNELAEKKGHYSRSKAEMPNAALNGERHYRTKNNFLWSLRELLCILKSRDNDEANFRKKFNDELNFSTGF